MNKAEPISPDCIAKVIVVVVKETEETERRKGLYVRLRKTGRGGQPSSTSRQLFHSFISVTSECKAKTISKGPEDKFLFPPIFSVPFKPAYVEVLD